MADVKMDTGFLRHIRKSIDDMNLTDLGRISDQLNDVIYKAENEIKNKYVNI